MRAPTRFLFALSIISVIFLSSSFTPITYDSLSQDVLAQTNQFRKSKGLPALVMNAGLNEIAQRHSANMAKGKVAFGHNGFSKREREAKKNMAGLNSFGENVAFGTMSPKDAVTGWKNSPGHRKNMLGDFKYIGIGVAKDRRGRIYYTQFFAG